MKKIMVLFFVGLMMGGCSPDCTDDPNLTTQEASWISMYVFRPVLIFKSDTDSFDTLHVTEDIA